MGGIVTRSLPTFSAVTRFQPEGHARHGAPIAVHVKAVSSHSSGNWRTVQASGSGRSLRVHLRAAGLAASDLTLTDSTGDGWYDGVLHGAPLVATPEMGLAMLALDTSGDGKADTLVTDAAGEGRYSRTVNRAAAPLSFLATMSTAEDGVTPSAAPTDGDQPLAPGWERVLSQSRGSYYYVNRRERKTTWDAKEAELPAWPMSPTPLSSRRSASQTDLSQPLAPGWETRWSRSEPNRFYYVHLETGKTTWNAQEARKLPGYKLNHPGYWRHAGREEEFLELVHTPSIFRHVQMLLASTFLSIRTRDRSSRMPVALEALKVWRVENSVVWRRYSTARERLRGFGVAPGGAPYIQRFHPPPKTSQLLPDRSWRRRDSRKRLSSHSSGGPSAESPKSAKCLDDSVNEAYLFHGTSPASALGIVNSGFDISKAVGSACYGPGIYFAECSSKSDEYSTEECAGLHKGDCAMLLCRVLLGRVLPWQQEFSPELAAAWAQGCYDSILGDRASLRGTYREFVLPPESCMGAYPEYLIVFRRRFEDMA